MEGTNRVTNVYYAVRNDDGTYGELHLLGDGIYDAKLTSECPIDAEELKDTIRRCGEEITLTCEVMMDADTWQKLLEAIGVFTDGAESVKESLDNMMRSIPYDPPKRAGFQPKRKSWESDKDDPSTFGAYINGKRKKKKRR